MKYYKLRHKETPWGDYSKILLTGLTAHSEELADKMEDVWEVVVPISGTFKEDDTFQCDNPSLDIMLPDNRCWFIVTERAKSWLEQNTDNWIDFTEVRTS
jgi:hypothetical protein